MGESAKDRRALVREAGFRPTSAISVVAGTFAALGLVAVVAGVAAAIVNGIGADTGSFSRHDWRVAGTVAAAVGVVIVFAGFALGGYTAGRMSRRMGFRHGVLVFVFGALAVSAVTAVLAATGVWTTLRDNLGANDVPVGSGTWSDIGIIAGVATAAAMLFGAVLGGVKGDRWHTQLTAAAERKRTQEPETPTESPSRRHALGQDETTIDLRDSTEATQPSLEEERENARAARADVGL